MPSIQVITQRKNFKQLFKEKLKSDFDVFISGSFKDGLRNIQKMDIDLILIDLQPIHLKSLNWIHTLFRMKNIENGEIGLIYIMDPEWISNPGFKTLIKFKNNLRFFWYNSQIYREENLFFESLEIYIKDKILELQSLRYASLCSYKLNMVNKSMMNLPIPINGTELSESEPVSFLPETNSNLDFLNSLKKSINEFPITVLAGPDGLEQTNIAQYIHNAGNKTNPMFVLDLATIQEYLHETILFGLNQKNLPGFKYIDNSLLEMVKKGTLYLKNIDQLKWETQHNLCETLKNRYYYRDDIKINIRCKFIFSTSVNLEKYVEKGLFRQDLNFYLSPYVITIPTIQQRKRDLPLIIDQYKIWFEKNYKKTVAVHPDAKLEISNNNYVGQFNQFFGYLFQLFSLANTELTLDIIRLTEKQKELSKKIKESNIQDSRDVLIAPQQFIRESSTNTIQFLFENQVDSYDVEYSLAEMEKEYIKHVLHKKFNNIAESSRILGISRKTLYDKLKKYKINSHLKNTG